MKRTILQAGFLALSASLVCAQTTTGPTTPPTPPTPAQIAANIVARLTTLLDLTSSQQATATTIFTADATTDQTIATGMKTAQTALETAITSNSGIVAAATTIANLTLQQVEADATADADFYQILTSTQQSKYTALGPLGQGSGGGAGGPGPGGPGGPPPGGPGAPGGSGGGQ
jgi:Spy/CpxP family protein refolding chaperone